MRSTDFVSRLLLFLFYQTLDLFRFAQVKIRNLS
jgi:hypothetical protein